MPRPYGKVWFNDSLCPLEDARVSVLDRGFLFGDGVYELLPVYDGVAFRLDQHLARLGRSLSEVAIDNPYDTAHWKHIIAEVINANDDRNVTVYIQVTRGTAAHRDHAFPQRPLTPTVLVYCAPLPQMPATLRHDGVKAITARDTRWARCDIKSTSLLANVLLRQQAAACGSAETFLHDGTFVIEGSASSVFAVIDGRILTPPDGNNILPGTTRNLVLELAASAADLDAGFAKIPLQQFRTAEEIWVCSSVREVLPVTQLDNQPVGAGKPGPLWQRIDALFQEYKQRLIREHAA